MTDINKDTDYLVSMSVVKSMLKNNFITDTEYEEIEQELSSKYKPVLSILYQNS